MFFGDRSALHRSLGPTPERGAGTNGMRQLAVVLVALAMAATFSAGVALTRDRSTEAFVVPTIEPVTPAPKATPLTATTHPVENYVECTEPVDIAIAAVEPRLPIDDLTLRMDGIGPFDFGGDADEVDDGISERLGAPSSATRQELVRYEPGGGEGFGPFAPCEGDLFSSGYSWYYEARRDTCWRMLCLLHAPGEDGSFRFVAWSLSVWNSDMADFGDTNAPPELPADPALYTDRGLGIGTPWGDLGEMYPAVTSSPGEGASAGYDIGWPPSCDGAVCGTGRLEGKRVAECVEGYQLNCPMRNDARVLSIWVGEHVEPTCC